MPPSSISAIASRVPSATSSVPTQRASAARRARARQRRAAGRSRARGTGSCAACACALTSPGSSTWRGRSWRAAAVKRPIRLVDGQHRDDSAVVDRDRELSSTSTCGSTRMVQRGRIRASTRCIGRGVLSARERRASIAARMRSNATGASGPVLNFALVFWALGCFRIGWCEAARITVAQRRPTNTKPVVSFHRLSSRGSGRGKGSFFSRTAASSERNHGHR